MSILYAGQSTFSFAIPKVKYTVSAFFSDFSQSTRAETTLLLADAPGISGVGYDMKS
jgi:predicted phosphoribosyltransferase